jgi:N-acetylglucosaminyl-diphospho-decaprenol L-rhamnosyltransferase
MVESAGTEDPLMPELACSPLPALPGLPGPVPASIMADASVLQAGAFREADGFSPRLWLGGEKELLADLLAAGHLLCYLPGATVHHQASVQRDPARRHWLGIRNTL